MHQYRCSGSCHGTMVGGPCSCGQLFYGQQNNSFSMFFSTPNSATSAASDMYSFESSSTSVDCTLSLGTPSTRLSNGNNHDKNKRRSTNSCVSNFCWDILQQSSKHSSSSSHYKSGRAAAADTLLSRRCANCDTTSTPLWRNGPKGPKVRNKINK